MKLILAVIIIFFVWNLLKKLFFKTFYTFPKNSQSQKTQTSKENLRPQKHGLNWDAETIEYEEVKKEKTK